MLDRPPRRQPGARGADGLAAQAGDVRPARPARHQGDRGWLPLGVDDRFRLRPQPDRERPDPGGHDDRGPHPGEARADRANIRVDRGGAARDRPPLQLDLDDAAARRLQARQGRDHRPGRPRHDALQEARRADLDGDRLPVLARELPRDRARLRARDLRGRDRRLGADRGGADDRQPADDGRGIPAERVRRPDGVVRAQRLTSATRSSSASTRTTIAGPPSRRPSSG